MILIPPALVQSPTIKLRAVHEDLDEALHTAKERETPTIGLLLGTSELRQQAMAFLSSSAGVRLRSRFEIWFPEPTKHDEMQAVLRKHKIPEKNVPRTIIFGPQGEFQGDAGISSAGSLDETLRLAADPQIALITPPSLDAIQKLFPNPSDAQQVLEFGTGRTANLGIGATEPFRTWLEELIKRAPQSLISLWAATRLVEAGATIKAGEVNPAQMLLDDSLWRMQYCLSNGEQIQREDLLDWSALGAPGVIDPKSPYLNNLRSKLSVSPIVPGRRFYAFIAPLLNPDDRDWVIASWDMSSHRSIPAKDKVENQVPFWLATDWLLAFGQPEDWDRFLARTGGSDWGEALIRLRSQVKGIGPYWKSPSILPGEMKDRVFLENFWNDPVSKLQTLGIEESRFISDGVVSLHIRHKPLFQPSFPEAAMELPAWERGDIMLQCLVDEYGKVAAIRPLPGYALFLFSPTALAYTSKISFYPCLVGGVPMPALFNYEWKFKIKF